MRLKGGEPLCDSRQVQARSKLQAFGQRHEAAGGQPFPVSVEFQAQRAFCVQQCSVECGDRERREADPALVERAPDLLGPVTGRVRRTVGVADIDQAQGIARFAFAGRECCVELCQDECRLDPAGEVSTGDPDGSNSGFGFRTAESFCFLRQLP